jgi:hypothetical protein
MSTDLTHDQARVGDERLGVIHSGSRYMLGFGRDYFGIWEQGAPAGPSERFPASERGRTAAWQRYIELEPSAEQAWAALIAPPPEEVEGGSRRKRWNRRRVMIFGIAAVVVLLAVVLVQRNKEPETSGGGGGGAVGKNAHVDVTGGATVSEDLTQTAFTFTGADTLYPKIEATWKGASVTMHMVLNVPNLGTNTTNQNPFRVLDFTLQSTGGPSGSPSAGESASPSGSPADTATGASTKFVSLGGECQIQLTTMEEDGIAGTFDCTGIPALTSSTTLIDAKGSLSAES